ncbi:hypothetical protein C0V78_06840 [Novosphingobium sp. TH158]|nr:hypothetical protein C0V78_06840 [Novosphingobium sp. TH158]
MLCVALAALVALPARADELRPGYLEFTEQAPGSWRLVWKAPMRGGIRPDTRPGLPANCTMGEIGETRIEPPFATYAWPVQCQGGIAGGRIGLSGLDAAQTDVLVRVAALGKPVEALRLTAAEPVATIPGEASTWQVGPTYLVIGIEHILSGYDHLLFVIALVLLLRRGWTLFKAATAFTLAHSITLGAATLGFIGLPQAPVEAGIALSIVFLAEEIAKRRDGELRLSERLPWLVAFAFGLLHGFGFAGALGEIGLPRGDVPMALLAFNLGVEAGQLVIIAGTMAALALVVRLAPRAQRPAVMAATYAIGAVSSMWLIDRIAI